MKDLRPVCQIATQCCIGSARHRASKSFRLVWNANNKGGARLAIAQAGVEGASNGDTGRVEIITESAVIEIARAKLDTDLPSSTGITDWGGSLWPSRGRLPFSPAFLKLHSVFTIRLRGGREAQVVKRTPLTRAGVQQSVEIAQAGGGPVPF